MFKKVDLMNDVEPKLRGAFRVMALTLGVEDDELEACPYEPYEHVNEAKPNKLILKTVGRGYREVITRCVNPNYLIYATFGLFGNRICLVRRAS